MVKKENNERILECTLFWKKIFWSASLLLVAAALFLFFLAGAQATPINNTAAEGLIAYAPLNQQTPSYRVWNSSQANFSRNFSNTVFVGADMTWVVTRANHERDEFIVGTQDRDLDVNIQIYNATAETWGNLLEVSTAVENVNYRSFDMIYEDISGRALLVYEINTTNDNTFGYRIWNGSAYSPEVIQTMNLTNAGSIRWLELKTKKGTNDLMLLVQTHGGAALKELYALPWNGSAFEIGKSITLSTNAASSTENHFAFGWETKSGDGIVVYGEGTDLYYRNYSAASGTWSTQGLLLGLGNSLDVARVCPDLTTDYIGIIIEDGGNDINVRMWNGTDFLPNPPSEDAATEPSGASNANVDCAWHTRGNLALFGFVDLNNLSVDYFTFTKPNTWSTNDLTITNETVAFASDDIAGLRFAEHPVTNEIMLIAMDILEDITAIRWNGTDFRTIPASPLETSTEVTGGSSEGVLFSWTAFDPIPEVTGLHANTSIKENDIVNITVTVRDTVAVDVVLGNVTLPNGTIISQRMTNLTNASGFNLSFRATSTSGNYSIRIIANDSSTHKNSNESTRASFIVDSIAPAITTLRPEAGSHQLNGSTINVSVIVTDSFLPIDSVVANISYSSCILVLCTTNKETLILQKVGNIYNYSFKNTTALSEYNITFIANDTNGNLNTTEKTNVTMVGQDLLNPVVTNLRPASNSFSSRNSIVNVSVTVTDNIGISTTIANITYPNNTTKEQLLLIAVGNLFNYSFGNTTAEGYYNITFTATDLVGNINATEKTNVTIDSTGPAVANTSPSIQSNASGNTVVNISARVTDEWLAVDSVHVNVSFPDNSTKEQLRLQRVGNIYNFSFANSTQSGIYNITFIANDTAGNLNLTQKTNITIDGLNPSITNIRPAANNFTAVGRVINISATVTDNLGINFVHVNITYPDNTTKEQLLLIAVGNLFNYSFGNTTAEGYYNITFTATDLVGNINATEKTNVTIDSTGPAVANLRPLVSSTDTNGTVINISVTATDQWLNVDRILANVTYPDNTTKEQLVLEKTNNIYNYSFRNTTQIGLYNITFIANDTASNLNTTEKTNITIFLQENIKPSVTNIQPLPNSFSAKNSILNISVNVIDNIGISTVVANITYPNNTTKEQLLLIAVGNLFNYSFGNTTTEGYYNITFTATDLVGNINATEKTNVTIDSTAPAVRNLTPPVSTEVRLNETVNLSSRATDLFLNVARVLANITYPNGSKEQVELQKSGDIYNYTWKNVTQVGVYSVIFIANDSLGNSNTTETTRFIRVTYNTNESHFDILDKNNASVSSYTSLLLSNSTGLLTKQITLHNHTIQRVLISEFNESSSYSIIKIENATADTGFQSTYAIDFSGLDFDHANVTVTAVGNEVNKCTNFSFDTVTCIGSYLFLQTIIPGQNYTITLNATDPGFGERSVALSPTPSVRGEAIAGGAGDGGSVGGLFDRVPATVAVEASKAGIPQEIIVPQRIKEIGSMSVLREPLFDIVTNLHKTQIKKGEALPVTISVLNFGSPGTINVTIIYTITLKTGEKILEEQEIFSIETQTQLFKTFFLPETILPGQYLFTAQLFYEQKEATAHAAFSVVQKEQISFLLTLFVFFVLAGGLYMIFISSYSSVPLRTISDIFRRIGYYYVEKKMFLRVVLEEWTLNTKEWYTRKMILLFIKQRLLGKLFGAT